MEQEINPIRPTKPLNYKYIILIIVTTLVSGGSVFLWQHGEVSGLKNSLLKEQALSKQQTDNHPTTSNGVTNTNVNVTAPNFQSSVKSGVYRNETAGYQLTFPVGEIDVTETRFLSIMEPNTWSYSTVFRKPRKFEVTFISDTLSDGGYEFSEDKEITEEKIIVAGKDLQKNTVKNQKGEIELIIVLNIASTKGFNHWFHIDFSSQPTAKELFDIDSIIKSFKVL